MAGTVRRCHLPTCLFQDFGVPRFHGLGERLAGRLLDFLDQLSVSPMLLAFGSAKDEETLAGRDFSVVLAPSPNSVDADQTPSLQQTAAVTLVGKAVYRDNFASR